MGLATKALCRKFVALQHGQQPGLATPLEGQLTVWQHASEDAINEEFKGSDSITPVLQGLSTLLSKECQHLQVIGRSYGPTVVQTVCTTQGGLDPLQYAQWLSCEKR